MPKSDVVIVGGGPAGLYTGWKLAAAGHDVILFEEHPTVGEPAHCTGVLAREAFEDFGLDPEAVLNDLRTVRFYAPSGDTIEYATRTVEAVVIDRPLFDRALADRAAGAGVRVTAVSGVHVDRDGVTVRAAATVARADLCAGLRRQLRPAAEARVRDARLLMRSAQASCPRTTAIQCIQCQIRPAVWLGGAVTRGDRALHVGGATTTPSATSIA